MTMLPAIDTLGFWHRFLRMFIAVVATGLLGTAYAQVPTLYAYNATNNHLISFSAATPGTLISDVAFSLLPSEILLGLEIRPATGDLYALAAVPPNVGRLLKINRANGAITQIGASLTTPMPTTAMYGLAFNPLVDRLRVVNNAGLNLRINPDSGAIVGTDTSLAYAAADVHFNAVPNVAHVAYTNTVGAPNTTAYAIDIGLNILVTIGSIGGTTSPNGGALNTIGSLGLGIGSASGGFDIRAGGNAAYAALRVGGVSTLYTINLATGAATVVGDIGNGSNEINGLTIPRLHPCLDLDGDGLLDPMTDGLMLLRAMFGLTGTAVTNNALPTPTPPRSTWAAIQTFANANCGTFFKP